MSCVYAMKYPQHIDHLLLISPVGVPRKPHDYEFDMSQFSWKQRMFFSTFRYFWEKNVTPHDIVRYAGPKGPDIVKRVVETRLGLSDSDPLKLLLADYLYHTLHDNGSGEYALNKILEIGVWARKPLYGRISHLKQFQVNLHDYVLPNEEEKKNDEDDDQNYLKRNPRARPQFKGFQHDKENSDSEIDASAVLEQFKNDEFPVNSNMKVDFIYGTYDWMVPSNGLKIKKKEKIKCNVYIVQDCGHQLILENSKGFCRNFSQKLLSEDKNIINCQRMQK